ncbi:phage baseplate assembly protein V [Hyphomicrobium sulfonivorans]|uniref:phage baseplate assembly protein V n=1 Tax=Hyphomicrobium sulfonivorans TaxID=121290 RepID=UPI00156EA222|nr:phage baseplate assembly protein V [Hyphomicrobium sulfonivorans]MBI1649874.1 phage baseplate assembly protein V [Hyphomicrobium sulfonivorans]NSL71785.1 hypothetical protein [Hyphomicrobium sulfonivorans]
MRELVDLALRVAELERRQANNFRHGTVEEVDAKKQLMRMRLGEGEDGQPFLGPWVPYAQIAGALKVHTPPSKGQQMTMISPTGDMRQAIALPMTWSDQNKSPSDKEDEHVLTFGDVRIEIKEKGLKLTVGDHSIEVTGEGTTYSNGKIEHDGHLIDKTHVHTEVMPGPALTGPPP